MRRILSTSLLLLKVYATMSTRPSADLPQSPEALFGARVLKVWAIQGVGVKEDADGVVEGYAVLRRVGRSFQRVPLEHPIEYIRNSGYPPSLDLPRRMYFLGNIVS